MGSATSSPYSTTFDYECVFSEPVSRFISRKATSINSNMGYLLSALLTSALFVLSMSMQLSTFTGFETVPNIVFVGPPSTGKSQAIKEAASGPLNRLIEDKDLVSFLIETATPSGLFKKLSEDNKGFLLSPEVYDVLFKLLQKDDDSNGYAALMCELFSGEGASYTMATRSERKISRNTPFSILGSTQLQPLARLLVAMDQGQGLIDRFIFIVPSCFRPTPEERAMSKNYAFDEDASEYLKEQEDAFITLLNDALRSGAVPPKCKKIDIAQRLALAIHVCENILSQILQGINPTASSDKINKDTLCKSFKFLDYFEMQKEILLEFVDMVTNSVMEEERRQPNVCDIKTVPKTAICLLIVDLW
ncbi:hypothetical protein HOLleu_04102 [Holothuria leucospilota]|uniref:Uncharacterized protein n=1 Tax=Holothuria leucospilota TaxID=206669 RepID=A0A9Q1HKL8_HOLLE|nr:hypothetical protein HOLleu_04102 [Holothuria leucospilota]